MGLQSGNLNKRPERAKFGDPYIALDTGEMFVSDGERWIRVGFGEELEIPEIPPFPETARFNIGDTVYTGDSPEAWAKLNLGKYVKQSALVILAVSASGDMGATAFRRAGDQDEYWNAGLGQATYGMSLARHDSMATLVLMTMTDDAGVVEWKTEITQQARVRLLAYIK